MDNKTDAFLMEGVFSIPYISIPYIRYRKENI